MKIDTDIHNTIRLLYSDDSNSKYRKVKIFPNYSLKHFKKYNLDNKNVLSKINSLDEQLDLISYNANLTCYSTNLLDEYFLKLLLKMHSLNRKNYLNFVFYDYGDHGKIFSKKFYNEVREQLDEETRYFFDEIYDYAIKNKLSISNLIERQHYPQKQLEMYTRNYLSSAYIDVDSDKKIDYWYLTDEEASTTFKENTFDFINLSCEIKKDNLKKLLKKEKDALNLLKSTGKVQSFVTRYKIDIPDHTIYETRSIKDPNTNNNDCKKDYAYMYKKSQ